MLSFLKDILSGKRYVRDRVAEARKKKKATGKPMEECLKESVEEAEKKSESKD